MSSGPSKLLHRYWLTFAQSDIDAAGLPQYFRLGCGVTAFSPDGALSLIQQRILRGANLPTLVSFVEDVDVRTLDAGHVIPNMEERVSRGIWYPMGFGFTRGPLLRGESADGRALACAGRPYAAGWRRYDFWLGINLLLFIGWVTFNLIVWVLTPTNSSIRFVAAGCWAALLVGAGTALKLFRFPRCHQFFDWFWTPVLAKRCGSCGLPKGAFADPTPGSTPP
jgi:hypothetical protein